MKLVGIIKNTSRYALNESVRKQARLTINKIRKEQEYQLLKNQVIKEIEESEKMDMNENKIKLIREASYSAKSAREGKDIGKPGKNFANIAKNAAKHYGSKKAGMRVAGAILAKLRKEEVNITEVLKASDPVGKWIDDFTHSENPKFDGKTKKERHKMALGAYYAAQKESYENPTEELAEGRGRPPKEGSKAWQVAKAKSSAGESSDQEADKNIVNQMRKKPIGDTHHLIFGNGEKKAVHVKHVNKALSMLANTAKPADREKLQSSLSHSHKRFMDTVTSGKAVEDMARPKVSLGKIKAESVEISDQGPEKAYIENGKVIVRKKARKDIKIEDLNIEDEISLNSLYSNLSEENKELFEEKIATNEGLIDLIKFARSQGF
jgi:hypothetical protein